MKTTYFSCSSEIWSYETGVKYRFGDNKGRVERW